MKPTLLPNFGIVATHGAWMGTHLMNMRVFAEASDDRKKTMLSQWQESITPTFRALTTDVLGNAKLGKTLQPGSEVNNYAASSSEKAQGVVMVIPIKGMMVKDEMGWWGCTSTKSTIKLISAAEANPSITAIVLAFDSGGGMVNGNYNLAEKVFTCSKHLVSHVDGMCASAALQVAAQSKGGIYMSSPTDYIGSIGVYQTHVSWQGWLDSIGIKYTYIVAEGGDNKVVAPGTSDLSEPDREKIEAQIAPLRDIMVAQIVEGRQGKIKATKDTFSGSVFNLADAKKQGLLDGRLSLEKTIIRAFRAGKKYKDKNKSSAKPNSTTNSNTNSTDMNEELVSSKGFFASLGEELGFGKKEATVPKTIEFTGEEQMKVKGMTGKLVGRIEELSTANATLTTEKTELTNQVADLTTKLDTANQTINDLKANSAGSTDILASQEYLDLKAKFDTLTEEKTKADNDLTAMTSEKDKLAAANTKLTEAYEKISKDGDASVSEVTGEDNPGKKEAKSPVAYDLNAYAEDIIKDMNWS